MRVLGLLPVTHSKYGSVCSHCDGYTRRLNNFTANRYAQTHIFVPDRGSYGRARLRKTPICAQMHPLTLSSLYTHTHTHKNAAVQVSSHARLCKKLSSRDKLLIHRVSAATGTAVVSDHAIVPACIPSNRCICTIVIDGVLLATCGAVAGLVQGRAVRLLAAAAPSSPGVRRRRRRRLWWRWRR